MLYVFYNVPWDMYFHCRIFLIVFILTPWAFQIQLSKQLKSINEEIQSFHKAVVFVFMIHLYQVLDLVYPCFQSLGRNNDFRYHTH